MIEVITPLVSVVIPTYNHGNYLGRAIQSIIDQTYQNWEIIIVDNHSTDHTDDVINDFDNLRIKHIKVHNKGIIAKSRNTGIHMANGEWIAFLDSDDWWRYNKLQTCADQMNLKIDLIYHDMEVCSGSRQLFRRKLIKSWQVKPPVINDLLLRGNPIVNSSVIVKKRLLLEAGGINESPDIIAAEDYNTWLRVSKITNGFLYIQKNLGYYWIHPQGISNNDGFKQERLAASEFYSLLNEKERSKAESRIRYSRGRFNYLRGNYKEAVIDLAYIVRNAELMLAIKSLWMIFQMLFR